MTFRACCCLLFLASATATDEVHCITGLGGYTATELALFLLSRGSRVRGTVRSEARNASYAHVLKKAEGLPGKLELCEGDLLVPGSFDKCFEGAHYVYHLATPSYDFSGSIEEGMRKPCVEGTLNALRSVKKSSTVKRTALQSGICGATCYHCSFFVNNPANGEAFGENDWTVISDETYQIAPWYIGVAEREQVAWKFAREEGIDFVSLGTPLLIGPIHGSRMDGWSQLYIRETAEGRGDKLKHSYFTMDTRDMAEMLVILAETPSASGRYFMKQEGSLSEQHSQDIVRKAYADAGIDIAEIVPTLPPSPAKINISRAAALLGRPLRSPYQSWHDGALSLLANGFVASTSEVKAEL